MARVTRASFSILAEHTFQVIEKVRLRTEMAEMMIALCGLLRHHAAHFQTVVAVKCIALDIDSLHLLAAENLFESIPDGGSSCA
jgi:hypothetical protein